MYEFWRKEKIKSGLRLDPEKQLFLKSVGPIISPIQLLLGLQPSWIQAYNTHPKQDPDPKFPAKSPFFYTHFHHLPAIYFIPQHKESTADSQPQSPPPQIASVSCVSLSTHTYTFRLMCFIMLVLLFFVSNSKD